MFVMCFAMTSFPQASFQQLPLLKSGSSIYKHPLNTLASHGFLLIAFLYPLHLSCFSLYLINCLLILWHELASMVIFLTDCAMLITPMTLIFPPFSLSKYLSISVSSFFLDIFLFAKAKMGKCRARTLLLSVFRHIGVLHSLLEMQSLRPLPKPSGSEPIFNKDHVILIYIKS